MTIENITHKLLSGQQLSDEEKAIFDDWMLNPENRKTFFELQHIRWAIHAIGISTKIDQTKSWEQLNKRLTHRRKTIPFRSYAAIAAIVIVCLGISFRLFTGRYETQPDSVAVSRQTVPDQQQAVLTLSTGRQIILSGHLAPLTEKNGTTIHSTDKQLIYNTTDTTSAVVYNTITVPRGGEYKLALSDGSAVWINSESEITYPANFGRDKREVLLKGEAFFEVQKDTTRPFIVQTNQFAIRVTGTRFNIRNYPRENASATLTQGSIQLEENNRITRLLPGQQASLIEGKVQVKEIDTEEAIAWRHGTFCFKQRRLESLLDEIARWYDIEIIYQDETTRNYHFTAWFRRSTPIRELIGILEKTQQIKLELKEKTLIVKTNHN